MFNYANPYNQQANLDRINNQIAELERMKTQMQQPMQSNQPITQNFQISPSNVPTIKYANSIDEVQRETINGDTPYFSRDMSVVWIKNIKGEIKTYELIEIIPKDNKDLQIEYLQSQIQELKKEMRKNESNDDEYVNGTVENEESSSFKATRRTKKE